MCTHACAAVGSGGTQTYHPLPPMLSWKAAQLPKEYDEFNAVADRIAHPNPKHGCERNQY